MNLFKKISSKNINEGFNLENLNNKNTDERAAAQVAPIQVRKEDITYEAILQQDGNPRYQEYLVLLSDPAKIASIHIFDHCGDNREVKKFLAWRMAAEPRNRCYATKAYLQSFDYDPELQLMIVASTLPPRCFCWCSRSYWGERSFKDPRVKDMVIYSRR
jgi:hypothetical protein